jgi:hypothetical protein
MTPLKATPDSLSTLSIFVSYRRLAPKFQHSLSAVTLGFYLCGVEHTVNGHGRYSITRLSAWPIQCSYLIFREHCHLPAEKTVDSLAAPHC